MARGMAQGDRIAKFHRVTDLFIEGKEVVLEESETEPVLVWVNKLNAFEQDEARRDGNVGRARGTLALDDPESPESQSFEGNLGVAEKDVLIRALIQLRTNEFYIAALDDIRTKDEWKDKVDLVERGLTLSADHPQGPTDEEREQFDKLLTKYDERVIELSETRAEQYRQDLLQEEIPELKKRYLSSYRESVGTQGFLTEYRVSELFFALRDCVASTKDDNGRWDHKDCAGHRQRLLEARSDVKGMPDALLALVRDALTDISMTPRDAGNSDAPASSSASSERPSAAADSTLSTPTET